mgnify:FL=1|tara:strand:- start:86 stop:571 length:486 start_codon:yes stop_codon:yes gene_type:complete
MKKVSLDTWIQLLGMIGLLGGLIFVGLEMKQSQIIALAAQQQSRTENFINILNAFSESGEASFYQVAIKVSQNEPLTPAEEILAQNFAHQTVWIFENDFIQYKAGLMDEDVWEAKLASIRGIANRCVYSDVVRYAIGFMTSELQDFIDFSDDLHCTDGQGL